MRTIPERLRDVLHRGAIQIDYLYLSIPSNAYCMQVIKKNRPNIGTIVIHSAGPSHSVNSPPSPTRLSKYQHTTPTRCWHVENGHGRCERSSIKAARMRGGGKCGPMRTKADKARGVNFYRMFADALYEWPLCRSNQVTGLTGWLFGVARRSAVGKVAGSVHQRQSGVARQRLLRRGGVVVADDCARSNRRRIRRCVVRSGLQQLRPVAITWTLLHLHLLLFTLSTHTHRTLHVLTAIFPGEPGQPVSPSILLLRLFPNCASF